MRRRGKSLEPKIIQRLRALCARALDERAPMPERQTSAMLLCRELRKAGFVEGETTLPIAEKISAPVFSHGRVHVRKQIIIEPEGEDHWGDASQSEK